MCIGGWVCECWWGLSQEYGVGRLRLAGRNPGEEGGGKAVLQVGSCYPGGNLWAGGVYEVEVRQGRRERKCVMGVWSTLPGCAGRLAGVFLCRSQK